MNDQSAISRHFVSDIGRHPKVDADNPVVGMNIDSGMRLRVDSFKSPDLFERKVAENLRKRRAQIICDLQN